MASDHRMSVWLEQSVRMQRETGMSSRRCMKHDEVQDGAWSLFCRRMVEQSEIICSLVLETHSVAVGNGL